MALTYATWRSGDIRVALEANRDWLNTFDAPLRNRLLRLAGVKVADEIRFKFFPRRIEAQTVKRAPFNYRLGGNSPMVHRGELMRRVFRGKIVASIPRSSPAGALALSIKIPTPFGHAVPKEIVQVWKTPQPEEIAFAGRRIGELLLTERGRLEAKSARGRNKTPGLRLSAAQRAELRNPRQFAAAITPRLSAGQVAALRSRRRR